LNVSDHSSEQQSTRATRTNLGFKRAPGQDPPVADGEQDRGGSLQDEVPMGIPDATQPQYEPPDIEIPSPEHTRAPSRESTDSLSNDMATVV
jgi:hypothetical protein